MLRGRGCFTAVELRVWLWCQKKFIPNLESCFSELMKREGWEEPLWFLGAPLLGVRRALERLVRGLKALEALTVFL